MSANAQCVTFASCLVFALSSSGCLNPFAPGLDTTQADVSCDPSSVEGIFRCMQNAYTFRDTTSYAPLLAPSFVFVYRDYDDHGIDKSWGRDTELRYTFNLFQNAQRLDLIWNNITSSSADSTSLTIVRGFNLTVTLNPAEIYIVSGQANMTFDRPTSASPWKITRWRDESNF